MGAIKPFILQICGYKNTGKTTFLNKLVKFFTAHNFKVGTIKHPKTHKKVEFEIDNPFLI